MRQTLIFTLLALTIAAVVTVLYAAPSKTGKQPVLTSVTTAVEGFQCGACAAKLQTFLGKQKGVTDVKTTMKPAQVTAKIDEKVLPVSKFMAAIDGQKNMHNKLYTASFVAFINAPMCKNEPKMCAACPPEIKKMLKDVKGITAVTLDDTGRIATIGLDPKVDVTTTAIAGALKKSKFNFIVSFTDPNPVKSKTKGEPWYTGDTYNISIGQGDLLVTPLWLNTYIGSIANGGKLMKPFIVKEIKEPDGRLVEEISPQVLGEAPFDKGTVDFVKQAMRQAVLSGTATILQNLPAPVAAKTGTAQVAGRGLNSLFTVFGPYDNPEITMTVLVENINQSQGLAMRVADDFLLWYFGEFKK